MKIIQTLLVLVLSTVFLFSCKKRNESPKFSANDLSLVDSGTFLPGGRATVTVNSPTLPDGNYTIYYFVHRSFQWVSHTRLQASLVMNNHTGTFQTIPLDTSNYVVIQTDSIVNSGGSGASVNRVTAFTDSIGMMTVQMNGSDFFKTPGVKATRNGSLVELMATLPKPGSISDYRYVILNPENKLGTQSLIDSMGAYGVLVIGTLSLNVFVRGEVTITSLAPLFTGSFSVTCLDSSKMTGTFNTFAP